MLKMYTFLLEFSEPYTKAEGDSTSSTLVDTKEIAASGGVSQAWKILGDRIWFHGNNYGGNLKKIELVGERKIKL